MIVESLRCRLVACRSLGAGSALLLSRKSLSILRALLLLMVYFGNVHDDGVVVCSHAHLT